MLVPRKSKIVEYQSVFLPELTFTLKVFDFEEDDEFSLLSFKHAQKDGNGDLKKDENGLNIINNEPYYIDMFNYGVESITGIDLKEDFDLPHKVIKEVVNKLRKVNSVLDLEK